MPPNVSSVVQSGHVRYPWRTIALLIALTAVVRLPGIDRPLLGNFATKNVVYAMVARNWAEGRAPLWTPTLDCLADGQRAWHLVEFPLSAYLSAAMWRLCGGSLDVWGRASAIAWSAASVAILYLLTRRWHGETAARAGAVMLALAPVSIIYGQSFMLEASVVALALATLYAIERWRSADGTVWLIAAACALALLLLTKIYMLVLLLPVGWLLFRAIDGSRGCWRPPLAACALMLLATVPAAAWYAYAASLADPLAPTADRVYYSVRQSAANHPLLHPLLFDPAFYAGLFRDVATVALTPVGLVLLVCGIACRAAWWHLPWLIACGVLVLLLPRKFHEMNYYYLVILPPLCMIAGMGWETLLRSGPSRQRLAAVIAIGVLCTIRYSLKPAFITPAEDAMVVRSAARVRAHARPGETIATMHGSAPDLLYYCDRPGLVIDPAGLACAEQLAAAQSLGVRLLVVASNEGNSVPEPTRRMLERFELIESGAVFQIYRLPESPTFATSDATLNTRGRSSPVGRR